MYTIRVFAYDRAGYHYSFPLASDGLDRRRLLHLARREVRGMNRYQTHKARMVSFGRRADGVRV
jgi:hypothetical protein